MVRTRPPMLAMAVALAVTVLVGHCLAGGADPPPAPLPEDAAPQAPAPPAMGYYVDGPGAVPAQLYPSPRPTPPVVGRTYITYPPLAPQEFLYSHRRVYVHRNSDGTRSRARVVWNRWPGMPALFSTFGMPY